MWSGWVRVSTAESGAPWAYRGQNDHGWPGVAGAPGIGEPVRMAPMSIRLVAAAKGVAGGALGVPPLCFPAAGPFFSPPWGPGPGAGPPPAPGWGAGEWGFFFSVLLVLLLVVGPLLAGGFLPPPPGGYVTPPFLTAAV